MCFPKDLFAALFSWHLLPGNLMPPCCLSYSLSVARFQESTFSSDLQDHYVLLCAEKVVPLTGILSPACPWLTLPSFSQAPLYPSWSYSEFFSLPHSSQPVHQAVLLVLLLNVSEISPSPYFKSNSFSLTVASLWSSFALVLSSTLPSKGMFF